MPIDQETVNYMYNAHIKPIEQRLNSHSKRIIKFENAQDSSEKVLTDIDYRLKTIEARLNTAGTWLKILVVGFVFPAVATLLVLGIKAWVNQP